MTILESQTIAISNFYYNCIKTCEAKTLPKYAILRMVVIANVYLTCHVISVLSGACFSLNAIH
jgi:hypothetical protein